MSVEARSIKVRYNWLKLMYVYTAVVAGGTGLLYILSRGTFTALTGIPPDEPMMAGIVACVYVAFGILSLLGLRSALKFLPVLLLQLTYKVIWFIAIILPLALAGQLPSYAIPLCALFATFIIGDLIAIPFRYLFSGEPARMPGVSAANG